MSSPVTILTQWTPLRRARTVNQTSNAFVAKAPMPAEPVDDAGDATGQASINMRNGGSATQNGLMILPLVVGADNVTASFRVLGWRLFGAPNDPTRLIWIGPIMLGEFDCIGDASLVGLVGRLVGTTEIFCDTITIVGTSGNPNVSCEILSPADGLNMAHVVVDTKGCDRVEISGKVGTATSFNALVAAF